MKWIRAELHNHSTHSDGALTPQALAEYADKHDFNVLALTDHNTTSGVAYLQEAVRKNQYDLSVLSGIEITTFYGHVLALGIGRMIDFTDLNPDQPEMFFRKLRTAGALAVGIAHPFVVGKPIMVGCRFEMNVRDWSSVDYIEIANTSIDESGNDLGLLGEVFSGNEQALEFWQSLIFMGNKIAAVTGKDIHQQPMDADVFVTYALMDDVAQVPETSAIIAAIHNQKTIVSKGPIFTAELKLNGLQIDFQTPDAYLSQIANEKFILETLDDMGEKNTYVTDLHLPMQIEVSQKANIIICKIYREVCDYKHLVAVGYPVYREV